MTVTLLPNFPLVNQLHEPTMDGQPDENPDWNCVPASLAAALMWLTGQPFDGDELKDARYGQGYTGAQAASQYVGYCRAHGVDLAPYDNASGAALVAHVHQQLAAGHPVVATIPSQWGTPYADPLHPSGSTHVVCFCGWDAGALRAMNPWGGFWHDGDDAYWAARLCFGQVWDLSKSAEVTQAMAWTKQADGTGRDGAGHACGTGFMAELIARNETGADGRLGETYVAGAQGFKSFLPLTNGDVLVWTGSQVTHDGALVASELWRLLVAAQHQPAPVPAVDPVKDRALAALQDLKAALAEL